MSYAETNEISNWDSIYFKSIQHSHEIHLRKKCHFAKIVDGAKIGSKDVIYLLVRKCVCETKPDKEYILRQRLISIKDFIDGVEIHVDERCYYDVKYLPDGRFKLDKICYCPKTQLSY